MNAQHKVHLIRRSRRDLHGVQTVSRLPSWTGMQIIRPWNPGDPQPGCGQRLERLEGGPAVLVGYRWSIPCNAPTVTVRRP